MIVMKMMNTWLMLHLCLEYPHERTHEHNILHINAADAVFAVQKLTSRLNERY